MLSDEIAEFQEVFDDPDQVVSDDPELAEAMRKQNSELAAAGVKRETTTFVKSAVPEKTDGMDLSEDVKRMNESVELPIPEDTEFEELDFEMPKIKVSKTLIDFQNNVALAQAHGIDWIEADRRVINHFTKPHYPKGKFFMYHGVRVIEAGMREVVEANLNMKMEEKIFQRGARSSD